VTEDYIRFYFEKPVNLSPVLTYGCRAGLHTPHDCEGKTWWDAQCQCACHRPATSQRAKVE
jgi:hypothetical protein